MAVKFGVDEGAELGIDGGKDLGELLDLGDSKRAGRERLGHLEPDVAGADDHRAADLAVLEGAHQCERVAHCVQEMHPVVGAEEVESGDRRSDRGRAGADDQRVVVDRFFGAVGGGDDDVVGVGVDSAGDGVEPQRHAGGLEVGGGAVGEVVPVADLAGDVVGDAADRVVRVGVGEHDCDLGGRVELADAERSGDASVATADRNQSHRAFTWRARRRSRDRRRAAVPRRRRRPE